jgi:hypothetical protein
MPLLQDKFATRNSRQNKNQGDKKVNFAKTDLKGGPKCQQWRPNNNYNNNYSQPQAGPSNQGHPTPNQKKFTPKWYEYNLQPHSTKFRPKGPNTEHNRVNHNNKKKVKLALLTELNNLKINSAILDKKDKGKSKAKTVQLVARINDTPNEYSSEALINRMQEMQPEVSLPDSELAPLMLLQHMEQEDSYKARGLNISAIRAYQARGFSCADYIEDDIACKNKEWKKQCEDDEIVSLGNEEPAYTMDTYM